MWLIIVSQINPFTIPRDINRMSVEIYDTSWTNHPEKIQSLMEYIKSALGNNLIYISYDNFKTAIYMKFINWTEKDSLLIEKILMEKGVNGYVVRH
jgi:hypothetical protein